jgi:hypothetical protein
VPPDVVVGGELADVVVSCGFVSVVSVVSVVAGVVGLVVVSGVVLGVVFFVLNPGGVGTTATLGAPTTVPLVSAAASVLGGAAPALPPPICPTP